MILPGRIGNPEPDWHDFEEAFLEILTHVEVEFIQARNHRVAFHKRLVRSSLQAGGCAAHESERRAFDAVQFDSDSRGRLAFGGINDVRCKFAGHGVGVPSVLRR